MADHKVHFPHCFVSKALLHLRPDYSEATVRDDPDGDKALFSANDTDVYFDNICTLCDLGPGVLYNPACILPHHICTRCALKWPNKCNVCRERFHPQMKIAKVSSGNSLLLVK